MLSTVVYISPNTPCCCCNFTSRSIKCTYQFYNVSQKIPLLLNRSVCIFLTRPAMNIAGHRWIPRAKASDVELWCFWSAPSINDWVNNSEAGDLRRHGAHYDFTVMTYHNSKLAVSCVKPLQTQWNEVSFTLTRWIKKRNHIATALGITVKYLI